MNFNFNKKFNNDEKENTKVTVENNNVELEDDLSELEDDLVELDDEDEEEASITKRNENNQLEGQLSLIPEEPSQKKNNFTKHTSKPVTKNKTKTPAVKSTVNTSKAKTKEEEIEGKLLEYSKIIVKVFGRKEYEFGPDEFKLLKLDELKNRLIVEKDYEEFVNGINWSLVPGQDKTVGYLVPTYKFNPKG